MWNVRLASLSNTNTYNDKDGSSIGPFLARASGFTNDTFHP